MTEVIVAFPKAEDVRAIKSILIKNGFSVVGVATSGAGAISQAENIGGGILICAYQFQDMLYSEVREYLNDRYDMLLICNPARLIDQSDSGVVHLPLPLKVHELIDTLDMMSAKLLRRRKKRHAVPAVRNEEDKACIDKAKEILIERNSMSEDEAHRYLQKSSMDNGVGLIETAQMIISIYASR